MNEYYSSFISEHTADYILIPSLINILRQEFKVVVPIFPWISREGNRFSRNIHQQDKFKVVAVFIW